jgi:hypothetical protein
LRGSAKPLVTVARTLSSDLKEPPFLFLGRRHNFVRRCCIDVLDNYAYHAIPLRRVIEALAGPVNNSNQPCFAFNVAAKLGLVMFFNAEHILPCIEQTTLYHGVWTFP